MTTDNPDVRRDRQIQLLRAACQAAIHDEDAGGMMPQTYEALKAALQSSDPDAPQSGREGA